MRVLSLFAGIGGLELGLERAGMVVAGQVELNPFALRVLRKNWPTVPKYGDIRDFNLMLSAEGFHARIFRLPEIGLALRANEAVYGLKCSKAFAWYDQSTSSWRTFQRCVSGGWAKFSGAWPKTGTIRNGVAYRLPMWEPHTKGREFSLWPTPTTDAATNRKGKYKQGGTSLSTAVQFPTPRTVRSAAAFFHEKDSIPPTWRTPQASEATHGGKNVRDSSGNPHLTSQVGGQLNPPWVEWLMGFPIGWTELSPSEMPLSLKSANSLEGV